MPRPVNSRMRFWLGLLAIVVLYTVYNVYLNDNKFIDSTSRTTRHVIRFSTILAAYGIGIFAFTRNGPAWLVQVWSILYIGVLIVLIGLGVLDAAVKGFSVSFRYTIVTVHEFMISPAPYVIAWLICRIC